MLLLMEGFDIVAPSDASKRGWDSIPSVVTGRFGTGQAIATSVTTTKLLKQASTATVVMQHAYKATAQTAPVTLFVGVLGGTRQFTVTYDPSSSTFKMYAGTSTLVATSATVPLSPAAWHFLEAVIVINSTSGSINLSRDGVLAFSASAINTQGAASASIDRAGFGGGASVDQFDDFIVLDSSGSRMNASIGDATVDAHFPTADGALHAFTPSFGTTHYDKIDESTPNATDYVSSSNPGDTDTYVVDDVATDATVLAVQVSMSALKDSTGARSVAPVIRQSGTNYVGTTQPLLVTEMFLTQIYETNPATSLPFTAADFNADEFGIQVTA